MDRLCVREYLRWTDYVYGNILDGPLSCTFVCTAEEGDVGRCSTK